MTLRNPAPLFLGFVGFLVGVAYLLRIMIPHGMDPTIMIAFGENSPAHSEYAQDLVGDVVVRSAFGHDGQNFFVQANDPWFLHPESHAILLDNAVYRGQRMGYPTIASGFGLLPPRAVIWTLPLVNVLAMAIGTFFTSRLAQLLGGSTWLGLAFCLNLGVLDELSISGGGVVALAFGVAAVLATEQGRVWAAAVLMACAALSRETMLAWAVVLGWILWRRRTKRWWALLLVPGIAVASWGIYIRFKLTGLRSSNIPYLASYPFEGPIEAWPFWRDSPSHLLIILAMAMVCIAFSIRVVQRNQLIGWVAAPSLLLASMASVSVWRYPYDIGRVLAPVLLAYPLLAFINSPLPFRGRSSGENSGPGNLS